MNTNKKIDNKNVIQINMKKKTNDKNIKEKNKILDLEEMKLDHLT